MPVTSRITHRFLRAFLSKPRSAILACVLFKAALHPFKYDRPLQVALVPFEYVHPVHDRSDSRSILTLSHAMTHSFPFSLLTQFLP